MKILTISVIILFLYPTFQRGYSQEFNLPYTAKAYWIELNKPEYRYLKQKQLNNDTLLNADKKWLMQYEEYLGDYFELLPASEKETYYLKKDEWYAEANLVDIQPAGKEKPRRNSELLLKHIGYSGLSGIIYGIMLDRIFGLNSPESTGLPMLLAGGSMLYPVFSPQYNNINNNSLWLRSHGKVAGGLYGYFLGMAIYGDNVHGRYNKAGEYIEEHEKEALAMSLLSSLGLGILGFRLGKQKDWSEGRVSLFQYYGYAVPSVTSAFVYATGYNHRRGYGINVLMSAPLGYLAAYKISQVTDYTRGDIGALVGVTVIGAAYGTSILSFAEIGNETAILFPTIGAISASAIGHLVLRDTRLTRPEGRRVNYAATGGAFIGFGLAFFLNPENEGWYLFLPASTGLIGYSILLNYYRKNQQKSLSLKRERLPGLHMNFYPENLIFTKIDTYGFIPPLVSASLRF
jgi:drug/metabolite transporter superfamily protein YnfA